jgi:HNH endonuclease
VSSHEKRAVKYEGYGWSRQHAAILSTGEGKYRGLRPKVRLRDGDRCVYCRQELSDTWSASDGKSLEVDHLIPKAAPPDAFARWGLTSSDVHDVINLVAACRKCNQAKKAQQNFWDFQQGSDAYDLVRDLLQGTPYLDTMDQGFFEQGFIDAASEVVTSLAADNFGEFESLASSLSIDLATCVSDKVREDDDLRDIVAAQNEIEYEWLLDAVHQIIEGSSTKSVVRDNIRRESETDRALGKPLRQLVQRCLEHYADTEESPTWCDVHENDYAEALIEYSTAEQLRRLSEDLEMMVTQPDGEFEELVSTTFYGAVVPLVVERVDSVLWAGQDAGQYDTGPVFQTEEVWISLANIAWLLKRNGAAVPATVSIGPGIFALSSTRKPDAWPPIHRVPAHQLRQ